MMLFLDLDNTVKSINAKHLLNDNAIKKIFMTKPDDDLLKILLDEVKEMEMHIEDICIDLIKRNTFF
jgi:hypothetical protein